MCNLYQIAFPFCADDEWSAADLTGRVVFAEKFRHVRFAGDNLLMCAGGTLENPETILREFSGRFVANLPATCSSKFSSGLLRCDFRQSNGSPMTGFVNGRGQVVITPKYAAASDFRGDRCTASLDVQEKGKGVIYRDRQWFIAPFPFFDFKSYRSRTLIQPLR